MGNPTPTHGSENRPQRARGQRRRFAADPKCESDLIYFVDAYPCACWNCKTMLGGWSPPDPPLWLMTPTNQKDGRIMLSRIMRTLKLKFSFYLQALRNSAATPFRPGIVATVRVAARNQRERG